MAKQPPKEVENFLVFVVEDDEWYRDLLGYVIGLNPEYSVKKFSTGKEAVACLHEKPHVVTLDYMLPDAKGEDILKQVKEQLPDSEVIVISEQDNIDTAVSLLRLGAYDYIVKTNDIKEKLLNLLNNIRKNEKLKSRIATLEKEVQGKYAFENFIIGQSDAMKQLFPLVQKATETNITVSITGETGTGKEVVAKAIHYNSPRKEGPFIAVNMAAIPRELAESELFGHEKGSFTGAMQARTGKFEEASGGTLLLDEIGEMDISLQAKLLRVLQEKEISAVGSNKLVKIDCRIVACTNKNLFEEVRNNRFREDLYYRLLGLQMHLPPLRERGNDILILSKYFIDNFCRENKMAPKTLSQEAQDKLMHHTYPGNVRELKSITELAVALSNKDVIEISDIMIPGTHNGAGGMLDKEMSLKDYEMMILEHYLKKYDNNIPLVAEKLDIGKSTIYKMLKEKEPK